MPLTRAAHGKKDTCPFASPHGLAQRGSHRPGIFCVFASSAIWRQLPHLNDPLPSFSVFWNVSGVFTANSELTSSPKKNFRTNLLTYTTSGHFYMTFSDIRIVQSQGQKHAYIGVEEERRSYQYSEP